MQKDLLQDTRERREGKSYSKNIKRPTRSNKVNKLKMASRAGAKWKKEIK